ncbi:MAG TPA: hypothetical protein VM432_10460 [Bdellovibrionales bacterium]|nr:hypothetical protein [Bdellovibrionales bacterium]
MSAPLRSQKGQGTVEYVLVLMITVVLILTVIARFNDSFRLYSERLFDGYLACLLETGELPGRSAECAAAYEGYASSGNPVVAGDPLGNWSANQPNSGSQPPASGSDGSKDGDAGTSGGKTSGEPSQASSGSAGGGSEVASNGGQSQGGSTSVGFLRSGGDSKRSTPVGKADGKDRAAAGNADSLLGTDAIGQVSGSDYANSRKKKTILRDFDYFGQKEDEARKNDRPTTAAIAKDTDGQETLKPKKVAEPERKPAVAKETNSEGFSFGYMIKLLLIAAIGIAIVIFFGGQILQASKSWEK